MKKKNKKTIKDIKRILKPLDDINPLPESLNANKIASLLEEHSNEKSNAKKIKRFTPKRLVSVAAAFAILIGSIAGTAVYFDRNYAFHKDSVNIKTNIDVTSYKEVEDAIWDYAKKQTSNNRIRLFNSLFGSKSTRMNDVADGAFGSDEVQEERAAEQSSNDTQSQTHGETNLQVEGVEEGDVIKNDGEHLYVASNGVVKIVKALPADDMKVVSKISFINENIEIKESTTTNSSAEIGAEPAMPDFDYDGYKYYYNYNNINDIYLTNKLLIVLTSNTKQIENEENNITEHRNVTQTSVYDVSDVSNPKEIGTYSQDGYYVSSRLIDSRLVVLTNYNILIYDDEATMRQKAVPCVGVSEEFDRIAYDDIVMMETTSPTSYLVASYTDITQSEMSPDYKAILGGGTNVYSSKDAIYAANMEYNYSTSVSRGIGDEVMTDSVSSSVDGYTNIFAFSLTEGKIEYKGTGKVPGFPLNQFSMDEYQGYFRIAVTEGNSNSVYILDKDLNITGSVKDMAEGEQIKSVRFMGNTGYVITFEQIDPLFVIDLKNPNKPEVLGELKIPGFSQYLHPIGNNLLLGLGVGGDENGVDNSAKISLFDVSDSKNPKEVDTFIIEGANANSMHKAFLTIKSDNSYVFPLYKWAQTDYSYSYLNGFQRIKVEDNKIVPLNFYADLSTPDSTRATYINDVLYGIDIQNSITAFNMENGEILGKVFLSA